ncbi:hypothetical protein A0H81_12031 [Grifola frondosa]|uniref:Zn(2)-C6 fungal-type domain-containing protein n=1 Tax=Grifola frondosa TaxID=5627 RepID=A0A1C7LTH9_GRIFR|nr:hypothetical protein A0H81_12031 [Grifola frondosa]
MSLPHDAPGGQAGPAAVQPAHILKRGARACTNCRKGNNRCEGEARLPIMWSDARSLTRHLSSLPRPDFAPPVCPLALCEAMTDSLLRFRFVPHRHATYGLVPNTTPSDDESEDTLPRSTLNPPIEMLQASPTPLRRLPPPRPIPLPGESLCHVAPADCSHELSRFKKRKRAEPTPRNAFPHVVENVRVFYPRSAAQSWIWRRALSLTQKPESFITCERAPVAPFS